MYEVVSPSGNATTQQLTNTHKVELDLKGKKLGLVLIPFPNGGTLLESVSRLIAQKFPGLEIVKVKSGKNLTWGEHTDSTFTEVVKESGIEAALVAVGC
jgi:hypothetical protein